MLLVSRAMAGERERGRESCDTFLRKSEFNSIHIYLAYREWFFTQMNKLVTNIGGNEDKDGIDILDHLKNSERTNIDHRPLARNDLI